eukprot:6210154-Pleurochrysis_carterae.AAC.2
MLRPRCVRLSWNAASTALHAGARTTKARSCSVVSMGSSLRLATAPMPRSRTHRHSPDAATTESPALP